MLTRLMRWLARRGASNDTSASLHAWLADNPTPALGRCDNHHGDHIKVDTCIGFVSRAARYHGGNNFGR